MATLRDGSGADDPRLGRCRSFDEHSREFPIRSAGVTVEPRSYTWRLNTPYVIDQYREGSCVGLCITNELLAWPAEVRFADRLATEKFAVQDVYWPAQRNDQWPGGAYPGASLRMDGTSVLAGMKVVHKARWIDSYRWAFGIQDLVHGLGRNGPAVLGIDWHHSMYRPVDGWVKVSGPVAGGHAILARAIKVVWLKNTRAIRGTWPALDQDRSYVLLRNSWGSSWGYNGDAKISVRDLSGLLSRGGEAVFALGRTARI